MKDLNVAREAAKRSMPRKADLTKLGTAPKHGERVRSEQVQRILDLARRQREEQRGAAPEDGAFLMADEARRRSEHAHRYHTAGADVDPIPAP